MYILPIGVLSPINRGPLFPPNNPAQDLLDYRYPFLLDSNSDSPPGKLDKKLKNLEVGKSFTVKFELAIAPTKTFLIDGSGYTYAGAVIVAWKLKFKRLA